MEVNGQLHNQPLYPQGKSPWYQLDRRLVGNEAGLDSVVKRKIPIPCRESNPRTPVLVSKLGTNILNEIFRKYSMRDWTVLNWLSLCFNVGVL
jgi:hypothetical protein